MTGCGWTDSSHEPRPNAPTRREGTGALSKSGMQCMRMATLELPLPRKLLRNLRDETNTPRPGDGTSCKGPHDGSTGYQYDSPQATATYTAPSPPPPASTTVPPAAPASTTVLQPHPRNSSSLYACHDILDSTRSFPPSHASRRSVLPLLTRSAVLAAAEDDEVVLRAQVHLVGVV
jgi:hypothetical protein